VEQGCRVRVHDPAAVSLPADLTGVARCDSPVAAAESAAALVVATEWPEYRAVDADALAAAMPAGLVVDANRFLGKTLGNDARFRVRSVGQVNR
jgi:UDPglucose 6-dehydrogenase